MLKYPFNDIEKIPVIIIIIATIGFGPGLLKSTVCVSESMLI